MLDLTEIQQRTDKATPGPWQAHSRNGFNPGQEPREIRGLDSFFGWVIDGPPNAERGQFSRGWDAHFVAHAREDIPALVEEVLALRTRVRELEEEETPA